MCAQGSGWGEDTPVCYKMICKILSNTPFIYSLTSRIPAFPHTFGITSFLSALEPTELLFSSWPLLHPLLLAWKALSLGLCRAAPSHSSLCSRHFPREGFRHPPQPTLISRVHHTLLSKISFLLNYSCVNFLRGLLIHTSVYVSAYAEGQGSL